MQHSSIAARLFYNAFYRWSIITTPSPCLRTCTHNAYRGYHSSSRLQDDAGQHEPDLTIRKHMVTKGERARVQRGPYKITRLRLPEAQQSPSSSSNPKSVKPPSVGARWRAMPVQTSVEMPFSSLGPWDEVIRYRSDSGIMIETALPATRVQELQKTYGPKIEGLGTHSGARVELGSVDEGVGKEERLCSVLISGTFKEAARVHHVFRPLGQGKKDSSLGRPGSGPGNEPPAVSTLHSSYQASIGHRLPKRWFTSAVQTGTERPFSSLSAGDQVVRHRDRENITVEVALLQDRVQAMQQRYGPKLKWLVEKTGANVVMSSASGDERLISTLISGSFHGAGYVFDAIMAVNSLTNFAPLSSKIRNAREELENWRILTHSLRPSETLRPWEFAFRSLDLEGDTTMLDTAIPEHFWQRGLQNQRSYDSFLRSAFGVSIEVGQPFRSQAFKLSDTAPDSVQSTEQLQEIRLLSLTGTVLQIYCAYIYMRGAGRRSGASIAVTTPASLLLPDDGSYPPPTHFAKIALPKAAGPSIAAHLCGNQADQIAAIRRQAKCLVRVPDKGNVIYLEGSVAAVQLAKQLIQERVDLICLHKGWDLDRKVTVLEEGELDDAAPNGANTVSDEHARAARKTEQDPQSAVAETKSDAERQAPEVEPTHHTSIADDMKMVLRPLTHPVVLITSRLPSRSTHVSPEGGLTVSRGVTVSSFTAVTLGAKPVISFNLKVPSRTWDAIESSGRLNVHILSATPEAAALAHVFTLPHDEPETPFRMIQKMGATVLVRQAKDAIRFAPPRIFKDGAVLGHIQARVSGDPDMKPVRVGDHVIVIAEVRSVLPAWRKEFDKTMEEAKEELEKAVGLAYSRREYREMGNGLKLPELPKIEHLGEQSSRAEVVAKEDEMEAAEDADLYPGEAIEDKDVQDSSDDKVAAEAMDHPTFEDYFRAIQEDVAEDERNELGEEDSNALNEAMDSTVAGRQGDQTQEAPVPKPAAKRKAADDEEDEYDLGFAQAEVSGVPHSLFQESHADAPPVADAPKAESQARYWSSSYAWGQPVAKRK